MALGHRSVELCKEWDESNVGETHGRVQDSQLRQLEDESVSVAAVL